MKVEEVDLDAPRVNEVLVRMVAAGLCHSDHHFISGDVPAPYPLVLGHEGAGIVEAVGEGVTRVGVGDHVIITFIPACGRCRWCASGESFLCDQGAGMLSGRLLDGTCRFHAPGGGDIGQVCYLGAFAEHTVVPDACLVKVPEDVNLESACIISCGVMTGWGAAVKRGQVRPGDVVVVYGIGGLGASAVQGARMAGAQEIFAIDPVEYKLDVAKSLGATHVINNSKVSAAEIAEAVRRVTSGQGADVTIMTPGVNSSELIAEAYLTIRKGGKLVLVGTPALSVSELRLPVTEFILSGKAILGCLYGSGNPSADLPMLVGLYRSGLLQVDELITRKYGLDDVMTGYDDMLAGRNVRGVIVF